MASEDLKYHRNRCHMLAARHKYKLVVQFVCWTIVLATFHLLLIQQCESSPPSSRSSNIQLVRVKRQQTDGAAGGQAGGSQGVSGNQASGSNPGNSPDGSVNGGGSGDQEDGKQDEPVASIKCDFGSAESPDLCKFKILDLADNPLSKSLSAWTHGSGKLALFQGGPLIDASGGNDTTGGYIFYETSNPFAGMTNNQSHANTMTNLQQQHTHLSDFNHHNQNQNLGNDYSSGLMNKQHQQQSSQQTNQHLFQHLTSSRVSVSGSSAPQATGGSSGMGLPLPGPSFITPNVNAPGPSGMCLSFQYAIQGLSAEELKINVVDQKTERLRQIWASSESAGSNWTKGEVLYSATNLHSLMFSAASSGSGSLVKDIQQRKFRGYIALDEIEINKHDTSGAEGPCRGHCNFDGDLCGWTNGENTQDDDFDWTFGRGSDNLFTGPARDFVSSTNNELTGSYLQIDSGYPRRPGDRAVLLSPMFQPTAVNEAMCMRFAVHMFGSGIGSLAIKIRYADESAAPPQQVAPPGGSPVDPASGAGGQATRPPVSGLASGSSSSSSSGMSNDLVIWEMSGDAGNSWHQAQTSVSSSKSPFQVVIEGVIGENHLGNIALDEISFSSGPCPTSPPVASKNYGDCTFEQSMCYWRNPDADIHLDDLDWIRSSEEQSIHGPNFDHTLKKRSGFYLKLENTFREPKSGTRAFLLSPIFQPKPQRSVQCLSFYYYMFMRSISSSGPNLGTIRVYLASNNELVPIWRLTNPISSPNWKHGRASLSTAIVDGQATAPTKLFQIAFEGIWGDASGGAIALDDITVFDGACDILPPEAKSVPGECTFDVDMCSWMNKTYDAYNGMDQTDPNRSPFLQSVNNAPGYSSVASKLMSASNAKRLSWQLATVDSRPVNLQDHTYKAPIGYVYVDVLDTNSQRMLFPLQSAEVTVQQGAQQVVQCLSFWFAAYGRQDSNQLSVYLTQASAPPPPPEDSGSSAAGPSPSRGNSGGQQSGGSASTGGASGVGQSNSVGGNQATPSSSTGGANQSGSGGINGQPNSALISGPGQDGEDPNAWKMIDGKLLWNISFGNITEPNRRKWLYGQVTLKADSNHIVRFVAATSDGGFALDDVSYFDGPCETRPFQAKVISEEDEGTSNNLPSAPARPPGA